MRSQLLVLSMISLAVSGCGKSVDRSASPVTQAQANGVPLTGTTPTGDCRDPIQLNYKKIENFGELARPTGTYSLVSFDAVGIAAQGTGTPAVVSAISVISGTAKADAGFDLTECRDLTAMPQQFYRWSATAPSSMTAQNGAIKQNIIINQRVYGPGLTDPSGPRQPERSIKREATTVCNSAYDVMDGNECAAAEFYQIDDKTIGVLRKTQKSENGMIIESKIFARYSTSAAPTTTPTVTTPTTTTPTTTTPTTTTPTTTTPTTTTPTTTPVKPVITTTPVKPVITTTPTTPKKGGQGTGGQGSGGQGSGGQGTMTPKTVVITPTTTAITPKTVTTPKTVIIITPTTTTTTPPTTATVNERSVEKTKTKTLTKTKSETESLDGASVLKTKTKTKSKSKKRTTVG